MQIQIGSVGRYWLRADATVLTYALEPGCLHSDAQHWFGAFVLGVVAHLQRRVVLHASAVVWAGTGFAFIGTGGTGKTTLAASFARCGAQLLSEDSLPVRVEGQRVVATPYVPGIRLWPESVFALHGTDVDFELALSWLSKKRVSVVGEWGRVAHHDAELHAIYDLAPDPSGTGEIRVAEVTMADKVMRLVGSTYFAAFLAPRQQVHLMDRLQAVSDAVRMRRISYPRRFDALPALREAIIRDAREVADGRL